MADFGPIQKAIAALGGHPYTLKVKLTNDTEIALSNKDTLIFEGSFLVKKEKNKEQYIPLYSVCDITLTQEASFDFSRVGNFFKTVFVTKIGLPFSIVGSLLVLAGLGYSLVNNLNLFHAKKSLLAIGLGVVILAAGFIYNTLIKKKK